MISRRLTILGGIPAVAEFCCGTVSAQTFPQSAKAEKRADPQPSICGDKLGAAVAPDVTPLHSSGDQRFDRFLPAEIAALNAAFRVRPRFVIFDDQGGALAVTRREKPQVTVYFGKSLVSDEKARDPDHWDSAIVGIMAHEWAHVFQLNSHLEERVFIWEEHADFMAGWYLGTKVAAGMQAIDAEAFARSLLAKGSKRGFWSPDDYGSPEQRSEISLRGYRYGTASFEAGQPPDPIAAAGVGYDYLTKRSFG